MPYRSIITLLFVTITFSYIGSAQEICNNGIDDDNDNLIDLKDPDCQCHFTVNGNLLMNGSFESYTQCPANYLYTTESGIASNWKFGSYTNINEAFFYHNLACAYDSQQIMLYMPPTLPLPDGTGFVSIQKNAYINAAVAESDMTKGYVGQCLQAPLKAGEDYILSFYAGRFRSWDDVYGKIFPFDVAVYGNADCNAVPFGKINAYGNGCPLNYPGWVLLGKTTIYGTGQWIQSKINLTIPKDINVIEIGPDCSILPPIVNLTDSTTFLDYHRYYLDDLHLLPTKEFPFEYIHAQIESSCSSNLILAAPAYTNATYQWYKDSIAITNATSSTYNVNITERHYYNVIVTTETKCITTEPYLVTESNLNKIHIPSDTVFCIEDNTLILAQEFDGISYTVNGITSKIVSITKEGLYNVTAKDITGCQKTFTVNITKTKCTTCEAHIPTAFTPNDDGKNDVFRPKFDCGVKDFAFIIFNKWGQKIFESKDANKGWDGVSKGNKMPQGAYVYIIQYTTQANIKKSAKGAFILML